MEVKTIARLILGIVPSLVLAVFPWDIPGDISFIVWMALWMALATAIALSMPALREIKRKGVRVAVGTLPMFAGFAAFLQSRSIASIAVLLYLCGLAYWNFFETFTADERKAREARKAEEAEAAKFRAENEHNEATQAFASKLNNIAHPHYPTLRRKRSQLLLRDDYGTLNSEKWERELNYFVETVLLGDLDLVTVARRVAILDGLLTDSSTVEEAQAHLRLTFGRLVEAGMNAVEVEAERLDDRKSMSGNDYEAYCHGLLDAADWNVVRKGGSGDQGIDLVAESNGRRVVIQCKCYSSPVGNTAVQEAIAGKAFEQADHAAVVSNAPYTPAARQLAATTGVLLLHHEQLTELSDILDGLPC